MPFVHYPGLLHIKKYVEMIYDIVQATEKIDMEEDKMIVRERLNDFVMIEQHHHASISGKLFDEVGANASWINNTLHEAIRYAIYYHDVGWSPFDAAPFWDDMHQEPYSFISYPNSIKTIIYRTGIDEVAAVDLYAALLCSEHYIRFLANDDTSQSQQFVQKERKRQAYIIGTLPHYKRDEFFIHYDLLQFFDNLSLYICLHELDASEEDIHFFFKKGIPLPTLYGGGTLSLAWKDNHIVLEASLFDEPIDIHLSQKVVAKEHIKAVGMREAWKDTLPQSVPLTLTH